MRDRNHDPFILSQATALRAVKDEPKTPLELAIRRLPCMVGFKGRPCDGQYVLAWHPDREQHPRPAPCCGACKRRLDEMLADDGKEAEAAHRIEMAIYAMYRHADAAAWFEWKPPTVGRPPAIKTESRTEPAKIPVKPVQGETECLACKYLGGCWEHGDGNLNFKSKPANFPSSLSKGLQKRPVLDPGLVGWPDAWPTPAGWSPGDVRAAAGPLRARAALRCATCGGTGEVPGRTYAARQLWRPCPDCDTRPASGD